MTVTTSAADFEPFGTYPPNLLQDAVRNIGRRLPMNYPGMRFSGWLRYLLQSTTRKPIDVVVLGHRMRLRLADNACERRLMVTPQFFDPDELQILRSIMRPDFQFVDLGANVGTYSLFVGRHAGAGSRILAVEPQQSLVRRLQENITLNGLDVRVAPVAVGDREGTIEFAVDTNNLGFTSLHTERRGRGEHKVVRLPMRKLLDLVREHGFERIDALKADIEGAEDLALIPFIEEAPPALWPRLIILEPNAREWRRDLIAFLRQRGYERVPSGGNCVAAPARLGRVLRAPTARETPSTDVRCAGRCGSGQPYGGSALLTQTRTSRTPGCRRPAQSFYRATFDTLVGPSSGLDVRQAVMSHSEAVTRQVEDAVTIVNDFLQKG